jgi:thiamine-monophosphate kinase
VVARVPFDEFGLIARLARRLPPARPDLVLGVGDDVAAVALGDDRLLLATCDALVEGVHFVVEGTEPRLIGRKAVAVNVSDIAAAGGRPTHLLISLVLPDGIDPVLLEGIYDGIAEEAQRWGADVIGGNVSRGPGLVIDVTLLGEAAPAELLRRSGARVGDEVLVTGTLGAAAAGLELQRRPDVQVATEHRLQALAAQRSPTPRLEESRALVREGGVHAAIDLSDGLAQDVGHVCTASGVGVRLELARLPVAPAARAVASATGRDELEWALGGGEDYELLLCVPPERVEALRAAVAFATGTELTRVGEIVAVAQGKTLVDAQGRSRPLPAVGWQHFNREQDDEGRA